MHRRRFSGYVKFLGGKMSVRFTENQEIKAVGTLNGLSASCPLWNILLMPGFLLPLAKLSMGSYTLIVVDKVEVFTEHTRCLPRPIPALKKLACPWIFFGLVASGF